MKVFGCENKIRKMDWSFNLLTFLLISSVQCVKYEKNCPHIMCPAYTFCNWTQKSCEECSVFCPENEKLCQSVICRDYSLQKMWKEVSTVAVELIGIGGSLVLLSVLWWKIKSLQAAAEVGLKLTNLFEPKERCLDDVQL